MMTPTPRVPRRLAAQRGPPPLARVMSIRCVQADHNSCGCDTDHPVPESDLFRAIEGDEAGYFRFQAADRLSGMDDLVRHRLRDRLLGRKTDLLPLELTQVLLPGRHALIHAAGAAGDYQRYPSGSALSLARTDQRD